MQYDIQKNINILQIKGKETYNFLQSIITNNLQDKCTYCFILSADGRYLFDLFLHKIDEQQYLAEVDSTLSNELITYLNFYKLRKQITVSDISDELCSVYTKTNSDPTKINCMLNIQDPRSQVLGNRIICEKTELNKIKAQEISDLYKQDKYENCIPDGFSDMKQNKSIILEYGAEELNGISYTKGCFPGQELMSRTKYRGAIRKSLFKITAQIDLTTAEKHIDIKDIDNKNVGTFCSGYKCYGIALLKKELVQNLNKLYINSSAIDFYTPTWLEEYKISN